MSEFSEWMAKYELYLDGKIEYRDLPPRPAPPSLPKAMTTQEAKDLVDGHVRSAHRASTKFLVLCTIPALVAVTAVMLALHAAWWVTWGAQFATGFASVRVFEWYLNRRPDPQLADKRDPTLDETSETDGSA